MNAAVQIGRILRLPCVLYTVWDMPRWVCDCAVTLPVDAGGVQVGPDSEALAEGETRHDAG